MVHMAVQIQNNLHRREQEIKSVAANYNVRISLSWSSQSWKPLQFYQRTFIFIGMFTHVFSVLVHQNI